MAKKIKNEKQRSEQPFLALLWLGPCRCFVWVQTWFQRALVFVLFHHSPRVALSDADVLWQDSHPGRLASEWVLLALGYAASPRGLGGSIRVGSGNQTGMRGAMLTPARRR